MRNPEPTAAAGPQPGHGRRLALSIERAIRAITRRPVSTSLPARLGPVSWCLGLLAFTRRAAAVLVLLVQRPQPFTAALPGSAAAAPRANRLCPVLSRRSRRRHSTALRADLGASLVDLPRRSRQHAFILRHPVVPPVVALTPRRARDPRQELTDQLGRGNDLADRLGRGDQMPEEPFAQCRRIADHNEQPPRAGNGHIQPLLEAQKADVAAPICADQRQDDDVLLAALERIDRVDLELPVSRPVVRSQ